MSNLKGCFSHKTDDWKTPSKMFNKIMELGFIDTFKFKSDDNEFCKIYEKKRLFCNPPFSKLNKIPEWIKSQLDHKCDILLLIPARTDTKYFHKLLEMNPLIVFIKGRLHYNDSGSAPFPSLFMAFSSQTEYLWKSVFHELDKILYKEE